MLTKYPLSALGDTCGGLLPQSECGSQLRGSMIMCVVNYQGPDWVLRDGSYKVSPGFDCGCQLMTWMVGSLGYSVGVS